MENTAPESLIWQGQRVYLLETKPLPNIAGSPTRYAYGTLLPNGDVDRIKLMQYQFQHKPIDWQRLEAENCEAPIRLERKPIRIDYAQEWKQRHTPQKRGNTPRKSRAFNPVPEPRLAVLSEAAKETIRAHIRPFGVKGE